MHGFHSCSGDDFTAQDPLLGTSYSTALLSELCMPQLKPSALEEMASEFQSFFQMTNGRNLSSQKLKKHFTFKK